MGKSYLEINGKSYDPVTGALISVDNMRPETKVSQPVIAAPAQPVARMRQAHQLASHAHARVTDASKTFNRKSVKRPSATKKPTIKTNGPSEASLTKRPVDSLIKKSSASVDPSRHQRAHLASKSASVAKFSNPSPALTSASTPSYPKTGRTFDIAPPPRRASPAAAAPALSIAVAPPKSQFAKLVENREKATNHRYLELPKTKKRSLAWLKPGHKRAASFAAVGLAILLLAGFFVFQNKANIELQLANSKAGINATLPDQVPTGYGVASFRYQPGIVAVNYKSSQDGHHFELIQKASGYASNSSLAALVAGNSSDYRTVQAAGRTVYLNTAGNKASAAWLDGGILHIIQGNASLGQDQLINLVSST